jgi:LPXTG-site transpeptidase (sortase) family protein
MTGERHGRRGRLGAATAAVLLVVAGGIALVVGVRAQESPPQPPAATGGVPIPRGPTTSDPAPATPAVQGPSLPASLPVRVDVPAIGARSALVQLGLNADGTVEVPPLERDSKAGWYRDSPTPGEVGPSVILGHVDSAEYGPGVFFRLGELRQGDEISVARADGSTAVFTVDRVVSVPKDDFPTLEVYGNTDRAELRLITCGGDFDPSARSYVDNIVVFASLTGSRPPTAEPAERENP